MQKLPIVLVLLGAASCSAAQSASTPSPTGARWIATWAASQSSAGMRPVAPAPDRVPTYVNTTIREIVHTSIGGERMRVRLSNEHGDVPIKIASTHVALRTTGSSIDGGTDRVITFGGNPSVIIRAGATVTSDPIDFRVPDVGDLAISLFLADSARTTTRHALGVQTTYIARAGNQVASATFTADTTMNSFIFLAGVDVINSRATGTIVAVGNSITDGFASTVNMNRRWPNVLAERLLAAKSEPIKSVVNAGISGNRVLTLGAGPSLVSRFEHDVLMQPGVSHVILLEGINDISRGDVGADDIIFAYAQLVARARERGVVIFGATLTPAERMNEAAQAKRTAVNTYIRTPGMFDAVIDFDSVTRDPAQPLRFLPLYDSGDKLHPSDAGYKAMAEAISLSLFRMKPRS